MRLNLGSGDQLLEGFENLDGKRGDSLYPLKSGEDKLEDASCAEIRA